MLLNEQELYGDVLNDYNRVLPGITGMWQVSGRNRTSYEDRLHYVEFYIQNWSIWLDLSVLVKTAWVVLKKEGAY
jgi:lipopolysaccharide/colanic/teichoic acid biosynthesis glycosyltransferase